jgi:hypothetical protein
MKTSRAVACGGVLFVLVAAAAYACAAPGGEGDSSADVAHAASIDLSEVRDRAEKMPIDDRNDIDKRIGITIERVNREVTAKGQKTVAARLATEFDMTAESLLDEKGEHGLSFGELVIARTLIANSSATVTLLDLLNLRSEGLGWGAIAFGLRFHMEDFEDAIKAGGRVAMGLSKPGRKSASLPSDRY